MTEKTKEILEKSEINENYLKLPNIILNRDEYVDVKKTLDGIGGKWKGGKIQAFTFNSSPKELLDNILGGKKINLKKDFQFFPTPSIIADRLVQLAEIEKEHTILEPSAGQGAIIEAIRKVSKKVIGYYELVKQNKDILESKELNTLCLGDDFIENKVLVKFDRIVANPPFTKNQDIIHLLKMYDCLNNNGILVCITSTSWERGTQKKQLEFKQWLKSVNAEILKIDAGSFKESGTNIETRIIKIKKTI